MKLENFAIIARVEGVTGQFVLTDGESHLFSNLIIDCLAEAHGQAKFVPIDSIELPPNPKVFPQ
ncbi:hypothetical protein A8A01_15385 [Ewingella americana]|nr:hypothetical protein A8A01_15385 [Ewingella americana]